MGVLWVCYGYPMVSIGSSSCAPIYSSRVIRSLCFFDCGCKDTKNIWDVQEKGEFIWRGSESIL